MCPDRSPTTLAPQRHLGRGLGQAPTCSQSGQTVLGAEHHQAWYQSQVLGKLPYLILL